MKSFTQWNNKSSYVVNLLHQIRDELYNIVPNAEIVLYGSRVRNEAQKNSDWDFFIIVDHPIDRTTITKIKDCLYDIELNNNEVLSSIVRTKQEWNSPKYNALPFKKIIEREGVII
jgi:predicted nucleotidyltransferase